MRVTKARQLNKLSKFRKSLIQEAFVQDMTILEKRDWTSKWHWHVSDMLLMFNRSVYEPTLFAYHSLLKYKLENPHKNAETKVASSSIHNMMELCAKALRSLHKANSLMPKGLDYEEYNFSDELSRMQTLAFEENAGVRKKGSLLKDRIQPREEAFMYILEFNHYFELYTRAVFSYLAQFDAVQFKNIRDSVISAKDLFTAAQAAGSFKTKMPKGYLVVQLVVGIKEFYLFEGAPLPAVTSYEEKQALSSKTEELGDPEVKKAVFNEILNTGVKSMQYVAELKISELNEVKLKDLAKQAGISLTAENLVFAKLVEEHTLQTALVEASVKLVSQKS